MAVILLTNSRMTGFFFPFRCQVQCSNGQVGFGRRKKRDLDDSPAAIQRVYEVSMSTIVKVGGNSTDIVVKDSQGNRKETFVSEEG